MVHFFEACWIAKKATFSAELSVVESLRRLVALWMTLFSNAMALVV
ncbi:hypothetical protein SAMN04487962_10417 [Marinobacter segnicrescens]|uniref:Uncharacterized protein n=1 Tax=Marinobacter segnicrescens TaxID=430453 RepID=A0A1I0BGX2_9GAMM|nr:hypothetical protein SAMN04487962_10417 [Marinobacter segnicrescens]